LLHRHREVHAELPDDPRQLRPIIYSEAHPDDRDADRIRTKILCNGAYDFISRAPEEMQEVLRSLGDMCELQEEMYKVIRGESWISRVMNNLGVGISIIDRNWKIWYCSPQNVRFTGLDPQEFHDNVCWVEYHDLRGAVVHCPECPSTMVLKGHLCADPKARRYRCITDKHPFDGMHKRPFVDHEKACAHIGCIGNRCTRAGRPLESYSNCRLLPIRNQYVEELRWVRVIAAPIYSRDGERVIAAVETVVDLHPVYQGYWEGQLLAGELSAKQMLEPALNIVNWLGYPRCQVFRTTEKAQELVGVAEIGGQLDVTEFEGHRLPSSEHLASSRADPPAGDEAVVRGRSAGTDRLGREFCSEYIAYTLRDPDDKDVIVGTLLVDHVTDRNAPTTRTYEQEDLERLRPVAKYAARILMLEKQYEDREASRRQARDLRELEKHAKTREKELEGTPLQEQAEALRVFLAEQLLNNLLGKELDVTGFHLRFLQDDGSLYLYREHDPYATLAKKQRIPPTDPHSLSAECFRQNGMRWRLAQEDLTLRQFPGRIATSDLSPAHKQAALSWCDRIQSLGCFPIFLGNRGLGTLAVQSRAKDFFESKSVGYMVDVCNLVARILGPVTQKQDHYRFWENAAYAFRGPASNMLDIAQTHWMYETDPEKRELAEGGLALAEYLFTRANNFFLETEAAGSMPRDLRDERLGRLWDRWCAIFRGTSQYGRKVIGLDILDDQVGLELNDVTVHTDPTLLTEIVYNIFENASKACRTRVCVAASFRGNEFIVDVKDDGKGISDTAFETMWEGHHEDYEIGAHRGYGLGLKWSKSHADRIGVTLCAAPKGGINGGAHFQIAIPVNGREP
ncbi:MAG: hypothetical protein HQ582_31240, partial [Planctomycetes bacterium]|nr:hypothetical protein [Planctomycetota bacterium]